MRIPRKQILEQRNFVINLNPIKYIHYRDLYKNIDKSNFFNCTKGDFNAVEKNPEHDNIHETWSRLKHSTSHDYFYKSKGNHPSQYIIDNENNLYRFSNHWGAVSSCEWTREGKGQLRMSVFETGDWEIGVINLNDLKIFRRSVDRRKDKVINPEWVNQILTVIPTRNLLAELKNSDEFISMSNDRKKFIGSNYGFFRKALFNIN